MEKPACLLFLLFAFPAAGFAQSQTSACILNTAVNGQTITVHGKAVHLPHDLAFDIPGCHDTVILTLPGGWGDHSGAAHLRKDKNLKLFLKYASATYKSNDKNICMQCMQYGDVEATLTGKLEIAAIPAGTTKDSLGLLHDASGKVVGKWGGWGHPLPFAGYRLVIFSVADVKARKLPKPEPDRQPKQ